MLKTLRGYFFWTYERGSLHYDVMVTMILLFIFISPQLIDYKDRPVLDVPEHATEMLIKDEGTVGSSHEFLYQIRAERVAGHPQSDEDFRAALLSVIEPVAGTVQIERYEPVKDAHGSVVAYSVWVLRQPS